MNPIYLTPRVYIFVGITVGLFVASGIWEVLFIPVLGFVVVWLFLLFFEGWQLWRLAAKITGKRALTDMLHLGDQQEITYELYNGNARPLFFQIYDDLPAKFQRRTSVCQGKISGKEKQEIPFSITPVERGLYTFGYCHVLMYNSFPGFIQYKKRIDDTADVRVHPSVLQMKRYEMMVVSGVAHQHGIRRVRMIGENDEFEQIRQYAQGDNIKSINWKATSRKQDILINTYHDSRSQEVYCIIDKGRTMEMPFQGMSLMDYSVNSALTFANIVLQKFDKAGLITFSNSIDDIVPTSSQKQHLNRISEVLYNQNTDFKETDFFVLYSFLRQHVRRRSILFLFTNFEDPYEIERNISYLRLINKYHLLIVISFINEEIENLMIRETNDRSEIYQNVLAQDTLHKRATYLQNLTAFGIQLVLVKPKDLSVAVINKYLEIKSKRLK